jgi:alpha-L-arabinofuranosidase
MKFPVVRLFHIFAFVGTLLIQSCKEDDPKVIAPPIINNFSANPASITAGQTSTLSWDVSNATTVTIDNNIGLVTGTSQSVSPNITTTYKLKVVNTGGADSATVTITVSPDPNTLEVTVNASTIKNPKPRKLLGITYDARSSLDAGGGLSTGYHDVATGTMLPALQPLWSRLPVESVRYPGNPVVMNWNWKLTIGPLANRQPQQLAPNSNNKLAFGFDEFMKMLEQRGLTGTDIQIMVNIYPIANEISAAQNAADWVEYCNAPNDGSNPGGGTDWAAQRAANGHATPYNVRIWNIGNEPWAPSELNFDPSQYIPLASPVINAMRAIDPTIQITLPAVGNVNSTWNSGIFNSATLAGKFWGISPHFFYDEDAATNNPNITQDETLLKSLETATLAKGLKIVIGDHAHDAPASNPDKGFKWEGALATANFLTMASQITNVERANYWIYGNWQATWHPIRRNTDGSFTFMAAAQVYEEFYPAMLDKSILATVALASGGTASSVRVSAFQSNDGLKLSIIAVNSDSSTDKKLGLPAVNGYTINKATLLTGALTDDTLTKTTATLQSDNTYNLSKSGVLILEFNKN